MGSPTRSFPVPVPTALLAVVLVAAACGSAPKRRVARVAPPATVNVGSCADPARDGILGERPQLDRADRDLNGDGLAELVVTDRTMCNEEGNCHWNLFARDAAADCHRYLGTVAARNIEALHGRGERGFLALRGWWRFAGGERLLMQEYRYERGGYRIVDAVMCRAAEDDRLLCADPPPR